MSRKPTIIVIPIVCIAAASIAAAQDSTVARAREAAPSSSLLVNTPVTIVPGGEMGGSADKAPHALRSVSLFAMAAPEPREFERHDLVQIIVRETSRAKSSQDLETEKKAKIEGEIPSWTNLSDLEDLRITTDDDEPTPEWEINFRNQFDGEGDYERKDDLSARLTAEVIEVLPNGNLVLEARTNIKTDDEEAVMKVTGICRPDDITAANTILSNQIHDLSIEKMHSGELHKTTEKGIISKALQLIFAF